MNSHAATMTVVNSCRNWHSFGTDLHGPRNGPNVFRIPGRLAANPASKDRSESSRFLDDWGQVHLLLDLNAILLHAELLVSPPFHPHFGVSVPALGASCVLLIQPMLPPVMATFHSISQGVLGQSNHAVTGNRLLTLNLHTSGLTMRLPAVWRDRLAVMTDKPVIVTCYRQLRTGRHLSEMPTIRRSSGLPQLNAPIGITRPWSVSQDVALAQGRF
jgi:hypothetical protein